MTRPRQVFALGSAGLLTPGPTGGINDEILAATQKSTPKVLFIPTASGDSALAVERFYDAFANRARRGVLRLFDRSALEVAVAVEAADVVYVGDGSTANLLSVWRTHELGMALTRAYRSGTVMAGMGAGADCWFSRSVNSSWGRGTSRAMHDGLGLVSGGMCTQYLSVPQRREEVAELVSPGFGWVWGVTEGAALHFVENGCVEVLVEADAAGAARVVWNDRQVVEEPLPIRVLSSLAPDSNPVVPQALSSTI